MKPTIGIEVHVELKSLSKVFSNSKNNFNDGVNDNVNVIDLGYPGVLPQLNKEVINMALKACLAFNCDITRTIHFDRKNYFYPDLPKGYQITQQDTPIGRNGFVSISDERHILLDRIHIEEDTCKSIHTDNTLLNFNRAGVPLLEIVTKPDLKSSDEAVSYLEKLRKTLLYLGISDVKIQEGSMRCDVNVSISDTDKLGTKCEIKNIGSINNVKIAIDYEIKRQTELLTNGEVIKEQTRKFDDKTKSTILMRMKEVGNDYRYLPEPDIPYIDITDEWIETIKNDMPILTDELTIKYEQLGINSKNIETILNNRQLCLFLEECLNEVDAITASNLLTGDISGYLNKQVILLSDTKLKKENFIELVKLITTNKISSKQAKQIIPLLLETDNNLSTIITSLKLEQINDSSKLLDLVLQVINENPQSIVEYPINQEKIVKYLMGQIMKKSQGQANPQIVNELLSEQLNLQMK